MWFEYALDNGDIIGCTMPEQRDPLGYYGYCAVQDGDPYCIIVSAARGQIEVEQPQPFNGLRSE